MKDKIVAFLAAIVAFFVVALVIFIVVYASTPRAHAEPYKFTLNFPHKVTAAGDLVVTSPDGVSRIMPRGTTIEYFDAEYYPHIKQGFLNPMPTPISPCTVSSGVFCDGFE